MIVFHNIDEDIFKQYSNLSIIGGLLFLIAGIIAITQPVIGGISFVWLLASLFIVIGIFKGYLVFKSHNSSAGAWFKAFGLVLSGILLFVFPVIGAATIAMLMSFYFFVDAFSSIYMGFEFRPISGWWSLVLNGVISLVLAIVLLVNWPFSSLAIVGVLVGISFVFDAVAMIYLGIVARKLGE
ncbi:MAG: hypothetical protein GXO40_06605 [Epsilonproteobacteria bacterium]|nr:hypothetical protein [Campylobacterota bacterium]